MNGIAATLLRVPALLVTLLAAPLVTASEPGPARADEVIARVLDLVERAYVEPGRIDPARMLEGAVQGARRACPELRVESEEGRRRAEGPAGARDLARAGAWSPASPEGRLAEALAPTLSALLDAASPPAGNESAERGRDLARAAILDGALRTLDRWSSAATAGGRDRLLRRQSGTVAGVGLRIGRRDGEIRVLDVLPDSGAEQAGLRAGDVLVEVGGRSVEGLVVARVLELLRGPSGGRVGMSVQRGAERVSREVERRPFEEPTVRGRFARSGVAVISVSRFSQRTSGQFRRELAALRARGEVRALVIDLRGNTGGSMLAAAGVGDQLLDSGVLLEALDRDDRPVPGLKPRVEATDGGDLETPIAVLVDGRSASSSELLASCLVRHDRAVLVGTRTFGKSLVGKLHHFPEADLTIKLSSATMRTAGEPLPPGGLEPDLWIVPDETAAPSGALFLTGDVGDEAAIDLLSTVLLAHGEASREASVEALSGCTAVDRGVGAPPRGPSD